MTMPKGLSLICLFLYASITLGMDAHRLPKELEDRINTATCHKKFAALFKKFFSPIVSLHLENDYVVAADFSLDGKKIACLCFDRDIKFYDVNELKLLKKIIDDPSDDDYVPFDWETLYPRILSEDIDIQTNDKKIFIYRKIHQEEHQYECETYDLEHNTISHDGLKERPLTQRVEEDKIIINFAPEEGDKWIAKNGHPIAFTTAFIWDYPNNRLITLKQLKHRVKSYFLLPDGKRLITTHDWGKMRLWDAENEVCLGKLDNTSPFGKIKMRARGDFLLISKSAYPLRILHNESMDNLGHDHYIYLKSIDKCEKLLGSPINFELFLRVLADRLRISKDEVKQREKEIIVSFSPTQQLILRNLFK